MNPDDLNLMKLTEIQNRAQRAERLREDMNRLVDLKSRPYINIVYNIDGRNHGIQISPDGYYSDMWKDVMDSITVALTKHIGKEYKEITGEDLRTV